ncbi:hypothetical protein HK096_005358 [Nowakowskiella sp. JEL0078]|nr:hypothetical protein HK096_005358 [Nowakowskiella sp. JEL0078]
MPVREAGIDKIKLLYQDHATGSPDSDAPKKLLSVPKELWQIIDFIYAHGTDVDGLFSEPGDPSTTEYLRECLDTGTLFDVQALLSNPPQQSSSGSTTVLGASSDTTSTTKSPTRPVAKGKRIAVLSMAEIFIQFLNALAEPVVPFRMFNVCVNENYQSFFSAKQIVQYGLPETNYLIFAYITGFLKELAANYSGNDDLGAEKLAEIFAPVILRTPPNNIGYELPSRSTSLPAATTAINPSTRQPIVTSQPPKLPPRQVKTQRSSSELASATQLPLFSNMMGGGNGGAGVVSRQSTGTTIAQKAPKHTAGSVITGTPIEIIKRKRVMFFSLFLDPANDL